MIIIKIYIDFDGTLYNTPKLYNQFISILKKHNINETIIKNKLNNIKNKNLNILSKKIIKEFNLNKSIIKELNNLYSTNLIYQDIIPFLEIYSKKYDLILLTLGNKKFQEKKINSTNINKYFKEIIITNKDKSKLEIDYHNSIFIDNNPYELKKFYKSKARYLIRIKRSNDKYSKINLNINNIIELKNFNELLNSNYIDKITKKLQTKY